MRNEIAKVITTCGGDQVGNALSLLVKVSFFNWTRLIMTVDGFKFRSNFLFIDDFLSDERLTSFARAGNSFKWGMFIKKFGKRL